jgi:hypothetical protein
MHPTRAEEKDPNWPQQVSCEIDIPKWWLVLAKNELLPDYQDVLNSLETGFDQGIPRHSLDGRPYFTPPNHDSAYKAQEKIERNFKEEIAAKQMYSPFLHEEVQTKFLFFFTSPLGVVVNGNGSVRPINNLSFPQNEPNTPLVNLFVKATDIQATWDDFQVVSSFLRQKKEPVKLAIFDWAKAYCQIPTARTQWPYLMTLDFNNKIILDTRIAFGGVAGCRSFGRPADAWKQIMLKEFNLVTIFQWVDNNMFFREESSTLEMPRIISCSNHLGVQTNKEKGAGFGDKQKYIGFIWNGARKKVHLPSDKLHKWISQIAEFMAPGNQLSFHNVEVMAGRLNQISYLLPQLRCYLNSLYCMLCGWEHKKALQPILDNVREDMQYCYTILLTFQGTRLIPNPAPTEIGWVGDALTKYGIGVLIGQH